MDTPTWLTEWQSDKTKVYDKEVEYQYRFGYFYEQESVEGSFDFGNEKENQEYLEEFKKGNYIALVAYVEVKLDGHKGTAYLGQCHVSSAEVEKEMIEMIETHGMKLEAMEDAKSSLERTIVKAKKYLNVQ